MKLSTGVSAALSVVALLSARWALSQSMRERHVAQSVSSADDAAAIAARDAAAMALDGDRSARDELPRSDHTQQPARPADGCPIDTVPVRGTHCNEVSEQCAQWADNDRGQCLRFAPRSRCVGQRFSLDFCMDRYEWPNHEGALPTVMVTYDTAASLCAARGRRLCSEDEWAFACAGEELLPYPYGRERSADACTIDLYARAPNKPLLHSSTVSVRSAEVDRIYMATPSGSRPACRSPFAVFDLTGNVDEWVRSTRDFGQPSALMGGFWGHVRNRCRAVTRSHGPRFSYYQIGFRCCMDRPGATQSASSARANR